MLGNYAVIDDKGGSKSRTLSGAVEAHGAELFVTSLTGESTSTPARLAGLEEKLARAPTTHPARIKYLDRVNYFGQTAEIDAQGRVVIPQRLRESAGMAGDVDVFGLVDHLDIWSHERFVSKMQREPFTDDDARALSEFGI